MRRTGFCFISSAVAGFTLSEFIMFLKNTWYVACASDEIAEKPLGRKICGEKIVFYRGAGGKVAALEDFCPHRGAALSLGFVRDGDLVCGYHGLQMGCE